VSATLVTVNIENVKSWKNKSITHASCLDDQIRPREITRAVRLRMLLRQGLLPNCVTIRRRFSSTSFLSLRRHAFDLKVESWES
jgi:hypothetical protein